MTCVAWDGKTIAADKRATCGNMVLTTTKLKTLDTGEILAWTGSQDSGMWLAQWYAEGANLDKWPSCQNDEKTWCRLIIANKLGAKYCERYPSFVTVEDKFMSWGCGADLARAAMYCGKTAKEAVEIACLFDNGCGNGVDVIML